MPPGPVEGRRHGKVRSLPEELDVAYTIGIDVRKIQDFGIGTYIRNLVQGLARVDSENRYVLLCRPADREHLDGLPHNFQPVTESAPVYSVRELVALSWHLWTYGLDLYHSTHYVLPAVVRSPVVVTIHDIIHLLYPDFLPSRFAFLYAQRMIRRSLVRGDRVIAVSQNTRSDLMQYFEMDGQKIEVVYNGVEEVFRHRLPEDEIERWLRSLGIERPYMLFVGNPKPHKNLDNVVKAYARARQLGNLDVPLVCVGARSGSEFKIRQRAQYLGIADKVRLLGHVAQEALPAIYQGASLFLYPTLYEGFGLPVVEAMACGVPVITSNTSALKEIAEGYAHLVDPLDTDGMARAMAHLMGDAERRASLARLGARRAEDFRWDETARQTLEIYLSVIEGREPVLDPRPGESPSDRPGEPGGAA